VGGACASTTKRPGLQSEGDRKDASQACASAEDAMLLFANLMLLPAVPAAVAQSNSSSMWDKCLEHGYGEAWCGFHLHGDDPADILRGCSWQTTSTMAAVEWAPAGTDTSAYELAYYTEYNSLCIRDAGDGNEWHIERYGPLTTWGGNDWYRITALNPLGHVASGSHDVLAYFSGHTAADDDTQLLAYPPIHEHHVHLLDASFQPMCCDKSVMLHGDDSCDKNDGGTSCYLTKYPPGFKTQLKFPMWGLNTEFNDVRPATEVPLVSYHLHGYLIAKDGIARKMAGMSTFRNAEDLIHGTPDWEESDQHKRPLNPRYHVAEPLSPNHVKWANRLTIPIPLNPARSFFWSHAPLHDYRGEFDVLYSYHHRHAAWLEDYWVFRGAHDFSALLGGAGEFKAHDWADGVSDGDVYDRVAALVTGGAEPFCQLKGSYAVTKYSPNQTCELDATTYHRAFPCRKTEPFAAGEELTIFAIAKPQGPQAAAVGAHANTHFLMRFFGECDPTKCVRPRWWTVITVVFLEGQGGDLTLYGLAIPPLTVLANYLLSNFPALMIRATVGQEKLALLAIILIVLSPPVLLAVLVLRVIVYARLRLRPAAHMRDLSGLQPGRPMSQTKSAAVPVRTAQAKAQAKANDEEAHKNLLRDT